jgi:hypothetical protein
MNIDVSADFVLQEEFVLEADPVAGSVYPFTQEGPQARGLGWTLGETGGLAPVVKTLAASLKTYLWVGMALHPFPSSWCFT